MLIEYDTVSHIFFCDGHVDKAEFLEALWEQWETDYCVTSTGDDIRHSRARFVRGNPGYWKESEKQSQGAKSITVIDGSVVNLGPIKCPTCDTLMAMESRGIDGIKEHEEWECRNCRTEMSIIRPR